MSRKDSNCDSDSEYELANEDFNDDAIDKVISEALGQEPVMLSEAISQAPVELPQTVDPVELPETLDKDPPEEQDTIQKNDILYSDDELIEIKKQVLLLKEDGNSSYKNGDEYAAIEFYTQGIDLCRKQLDDVRSILHANRAACHIKKSEHTEAEEDCNISISLAPQYCKAILRRAQVREKLEKLTLALEDYKTVLELDPKQNNAIEAVRRLPNEIQIQQEKMKEECMSKLKDLGNLVLKPFGLSTDNFKMVQDPNSGGYNVQFSQEK